MPIGKDSITKRVAKTEEPAKAEAVKTEAKPAAKKTSASSACAKKTSTTASSTKKTSSTTAKKAPAKKVAEVNTGVISNIAPETVEKVVGHKENDTVKKVSVGEEMPVYLL